MRPARRTSLLRTRAQGGPSVELAAVLTLALLLSGCSMFTGQPRAVSRHQTSSPMQTPSDRLLPTGRIGSATIATSDGHRLGSATIDEYRTDIRVTLDIETLPTGSSLRISTSPATAECPGDQNALDFGQIESGTTTRPLPSDLMPRTDPTHWRSLLLVESTSPDKARQCVLTLVAAAPIHWDIAPAGLSQAIHDSGPERYARGTIRIGPSGPKTYTPSAGDTPTAVAARLGITVEDLHWLSPMEFDLRAGMPINLDPNSRGLPAS